MPRSRAAAAVEAGQARPAGAGAGMRSEMVGRDVVLGIERRPIDDDSPRHGSGGVRRVSGRGGGGGSGRRVLVCAWAGTPRTGGRNSMLVLLVLLVAHSLSLLSSSTTCM